MPRVGVPAALDVRIDGKFFQSAAGKRIPVLSDFALRIETGEVAALVGPSGCGKTTLLRLIAGLDPDYKGNIVKPARGRLGMVFQEPRLLPWRSVFENLRIAAPGAAHDDLDALLTAFQLGDCRDRYPGEISGGMARRLALARAFAVEPDLLLLDEPFVSLDAKLAASLREELALMVERRPVTTLLVTHDMDEAITLADRLILLSGRPCGVIADIGISERRGARPPELIAAIRVEAARRLANV